MWKHEKYYIITKVKKSTKQKDFADEGLEDLQGEGFEKEVKKEGLV